MPELSAEQERARTAFLQWFHSPHKARPYFFLAGFAGTGKSFTISAIIDSIKGKVLLAAPTGKAALVMSKATGRPAQTIHSLIYTPKGTGGNKVAIEKIQAELLTLDPNTDRAKQLTRELKKLLSDVKPLFSLNLESNLVGASLLVVDEVSMVGIPMMEDLLSFGVPILVQGDIGQLPPVMAESFFKQNECDICLTEIHRQAKDSPIIYLATLAREGKPLPIGQHGDSKVTRDVSPEEALAHDQIIVGKNETRHATNAKVRQLEGREGPYPNVGEKVICRRNNSKLGLMNGDQFIVTSYDQLTKDTGWIGIDNDTVSTKVQCHSEYFLYKEPDPWNISKAECIQWGAAITGHSSQGAQWPSVYVLDQSRVFRQDARKWAYTCYTRAQKRLTIKLT